MAFANLQKTVHGDTSEELDEKINKLLSKGWVNMNNLIISPNPNGRRVFYQQLIKPLEIADKDNTSTEKL